MIEKLMKLRKDYKDKIENYYEIRIENAKKERTDNRHKGLSNQDVNKELHGLESARQAYYQSMCDIDNIIEDFLFEQKNKKNVDK